MVVCKENKLLDKDNLICWTIYANMNLIWV